MPPNPKVQQFLESEAIKEEQARLNYLESLKPKEEQIRNNVPGRHANKPELPVEHPSHAVKVYEGYFNPNKLVTREQTNNRIKGIPNNVIGIPSYRTIIQEGGRRRTRRRQRGRRTRRHRNKKRRTHRR